MRLINTRTLKMQEFISRPPPYAILSHTWGKGEVSIQDFHSLPLREKKQGFSKIKATCQQARNQGLDYAWVDTCCIDKTSSSDLGEAINSMFKWYRDSAVCYAFLEDIPSEDSTPDETTRNTTTLGFGHSRWFTRGWTLQELIAPSRVEFYNRSWQQIGGKKELATSLATATGIDAFILDGTGDLGQVSVGRRMSWAVDRETAREEDIAYSLLGIFNVNMALIYGEGARAFLRLQEKILQHSDDHTIFAWRGSPLSVNREEARGLFATSPNEFRNFL
ncbi:heterokaryon incompatibility protein-domain-containing protein, partial [Thelonectria olida]